VIYTLTLNPAVDRELAIDVFEFNTVLRATDWRVDFGGKGFNVSRMLRVLDQQSIALAFAGGKSGELLEQGLQGLGIGTDFVWVPGETRTNVSVVSHQEARHIKVNEPGPTISVERQDALLEKVAGLAKAGDWWVLAGSLPPGVPEDYYGRLVKILSAAGANSVLDTSGKALHHGCAAGPYLVKPNAFEAGQLSGLPVNSQAELVSAARLILQLGPENVVVSLGKDGALLVEQDRASSVNSPKIEERNPIGAGDAMVAGLVYGLVSGDTTSEALRWGIACGAVAASQSGTAMGDRDQVEALRAQTVLTAIS